MGMNSAAASGVMANMYRESRFYVDITNDYGTAYGLCHWYGDRWTNLQNYCNNNGLGLAYPVRPDALFGI